MVTVDFSHNPLTVPPIVKFFALLVPPQNLKVDFQFLRPLFYFNSLRLGCLGFFILVTLFSSITVYVQSPVIPCTYLLLATALSPLPYC